jgi:copper chaperone
MQQVILHVNGMSCQHCVNSIEKGLKEIGASGQVDLKANSVAVEYDETKLNLDTIKEAIEDQGYEIA